MTDYNGPGAQPPYYGPGPAQPPYGQQGPQGAPPQPPYPGQPPYGQQPAPGAESPYNQPTQTTQPAAGPQQGFTQPPPGYGQPQPGPAQPQYGQPQYGPLGYGQAPYVGYQPPQRGNRNTWLIGTGIGLAVVLVVVAVVVVVKLGSKSPTPNPTPGPTAQPTSSPNPTGTSSGNVPAGVISGSSGLSGCPQPSTGPFKLAQPSSVCGIPMSTDSDLTQIAQTELQTSELAFTYPGGFGSYTSTVSFVAEPPQNSSSQYFNIQVFGFNGTFSNPTAAVKAMEIDPTEKFYNVPPGPDGGVMQCADDKTDSLQECWWATSTTLADVQFYFSNLSIPSGISADASAIDVRNAVEIHS